MNSRIDETQLVLKVDLQELRAESQRCNSLPSYSLEASKLSMKIREIVKQDELVTNIELSTYASEAMKTGSKNDSSQIIETILLSISAAGGFSGLGILVAKIIEASKQKIPTIYEIDMPDIGKIKISGPSIDKKNMSILDSMVSDLKNKHSNNPNKERIIHIKARLED